MGRVTCTVQGVGVQLWVGKHVFIIYSVVGLGEGGGNRKAYILKVPSYSPIILYPYSNINQLFKSHKSPNLSIPQSANLITQSPNDP